MPEEASQPRDSDDADLEREIRLQRKFSLADAIGRMAGADLMKGASPVTRKRQAELTVEKFLEGNLVDAEGALEVVLNRRVRDSQILLETGYDRPLVTLALVLERILQSDELLHRFVDSVDAEWGRMYDERPHFQRGGRPPDQEDPYTFSTVRATLFQLLEKLRSA